VIICLVNTYILSLITWHNTILRKVSKYVFLSNLSIQSNITFKIKLTFGSDFYTVNNNSQKNAELSHAVA
jgi:hypothetical protein